MGNREKGYKECYVRVKYERDGKKVDQSFLPLRSVVESAEDGCKYTTTPFIFLKLQPKPILLAQLFRESRRPIFFGSKSLESHLFRFKRKLGTPC